MLERQSMVSQMWGSLDSDAGSVKLLVPCFGHRMLMLTASPLTCLDLHFERALGH